MPSDHYQPLQLKGEIMDLEFTMDTDHRYVYPFPSFPSRGILTRRAQKAQEEQNNTELLELPHLKTKSEFARMSDAIEKDPVSDVFNWTGLCVYEIDDPALRDDPTLDETTRLRNRIAELESLVRELRGKPHPRWADSNFRDGDPNEKWHSRAAKCLPSGKRRAASPELVQDQTPPSQPANGRSGVLATLLSPIKTETATDPSSQLYRFSPSPAPSMRYHTFQADVRGSPTNSPYESSSDHRSPYRSPTSAGSYHSPAHHTSSSSYNNGTSGGTAPPSSYSDGGSNGSAYPLSGSDDGRPYSDHFSARGSPPDTHGYCHCRTSPALSSSYLALSQQVQNTLHTARQYGSHPANSRCALYRQIIELNNLLQSRLDVDECHSGPAYDSNTPTDSEILTPASTSSGPTSFHAGSPGGVSPHEWTSTTLSPTTYNPYFPLHPGPAESHTIYTHVMS
ncbi:hypothetical protein VNI00_003638 [Paramarasmius palmivorus]|uniref:BAG domain-containing protein n=1 Tax=Paramarasmius palmivorus TaxID=297713 RepID=A0AAW0DSW9_9AGAR